MNADERSFSTSYSGPAGSTSSSCQTNETNGNVECNESDDKVPSHVSVLEFFHGQAEAVKLLYKDDDGPSTMSLKLNLNASSSPTNNINDLIADTEAADYNSTDSASDNNSNNFFAIQPHFSEESDCSDENSDNEKPLSSCESSMDHEGDILSETNMESSERDEELIHAKQCADNNGKISFDISCPPAYIPSVHPNSEIKRLLEKNTMRYYKKLNDAEYSKYANMYLPYPVFPVKEMESIDNAAIDEINDFSLCQNTELMKRLESHPTTVGKPFKCFVCGKSFKTDFDLETHMNKHTSEKPFKCTECTKSFCYKVDLENHTRTHTGEKPFACNECDKKFNRKSVLARHKRTHTGMKRFVCEVCELSFYERNDYNRHFRIHTGERPFKCNQCDKSYTRQSQLQKHLKSHTGVKPFVCDECGKSFISKGDIVKHMKIHSGERPYKCDECNKDFLYKSDIVRHMRTHTGEKPYNCLECGKCFGNKSDIVRHMRSHTGERPFECCHCQKNFRNPGGLQRHLRNYHPDIGGGDQASQDQESINPELTLSSSANSSESYAPTDSDPTAASSSSGS